MVKGRIFDQKIHKILIILDKYLKILFYKFEFLFYHIYIYIYIYIWMYKNSLFLTNYSCDKILELIDIRPFKLYFIGCLALATSP